MKRNIVLLISIVVIGTFLMAPKANAYTTILRVGSRGTEVKTLQTNLRFLGYNTGIIDGVFGQATKYAVINFQKNHGLQADGVVGTMTSTAINKVVTRKRTTNGILYTSKGLIGIPYQWGGTTTSGFDCSGFTGYVFAKNGITLPRNSRDQYNLGRPVAFSSLIPGDLVFFSLDGSGRVSHVGIYIGNGQFINATTSKGVAISSFTSYWSNVYVGARRVY